MAGKFELPLGYSKDLECQVLEMPFSQKRISMFLLLPDDPVNGLNRLEGNISTENIKHLLSIKTLKVCIIKKNMSISNGLTHFLKRLYINFRMKS